MRRPTASGSIWQAAVAVVLTIGLFAASAQADGTADNVPEKVRSIPPAGIEVPAADRADLEKELTTFDAELKQLDEKKDPLVRRLLPDVQVYRKAVHDALTYNEFNKDDVGRAKSLLQEGRQRAGQLLAGQAPWDTATGLVVRGYVSRIDGSVQPYGVVVPPSYAAQGTFRHPLDVWFHGRDETLNEIKFLDQRRHSRGEFTPPETIVLHPYGRYCNAFKFAGEVDVLEALESVKQHYRVDPDRIAVRGFSMGGAACWHFAVHYASNWVAANPGAGFAETPAFLKVFQNETVEPSEFQRKLWHLYDCTDWAGNLFNCPTVAYSGELDKQKQAADIMAVALDKEGITLRHVIGPGAKHFYEPGAKHTVEQIMADIVERGRNRVPDAVHLTTYTLKYNQQAWLTVDALLEHWKVARADADLSGDPLAIKTENIAQISLDIPPGRLPNNFDVREPVNIEIDDQTLEGPRPRSDNSWSCTLRLNSGKWELGALTDKSADKGDEKSNETPLRKRHGLQGPIDDAFMDSFEFVRPTGQEKRPAVEKWVASESDRAIHEWRRQFRGEAPVKSDTAVSDDDIAASNLVLWGTPESNAVLKRIADKLPIRWEGDQIIVGERKYAADQHIPILIYPNPLNPKRYVVLNSGFTFREYDYLSNARQVPKLPDWAIIDLRTPPDSQFPGKVVEANFFGEKWEVQAPEKSGE